MINVPGCCHVRSYEYVNLWKWFGPLKKHDPSTVSASVGANWQHPEICMVWHFCRWSQTLLPKRELKFSSVFLATRRPGMWTLPFPVGNILSEMCRVTFLLGWWTSSRSKKCGKSSRRIPLDILTQDNVLGLNSHILEGLKSHKIKFHLSTGVFCRTNQLVWHLSLWKLYPWELSDILRLESTFGNIRFLVAFFWVYHLETVFLEFWNSKDFYAETRGESFPNASDICFYMCDAKWVCLKLKGV